MVLRQLVGYMTITFIKFACLLVKCVPDVATELRAIYDPELVLWRFYPTASIIGLAADFDDCINAELQRTYKFELTATSIIDMGIIKAFSWNFVIYVFKNLITVAASIPRAPIRDEQYYELALLLIASEFSCHTTNTTFSPISSIPFLTLSIFSKVPSSWLHV